jgi:GDP-D-mannose 3',5'-epimerase
MSKDISKIYVTGSAGMIGSTLCATLLAQGHEVVGVDNLWRGSTANMADFLEHPRFSFRHADIAADRDWYIDMDADSVIVHTADIVAGIGYVFSNEWAIFQKNVLINTQIARLVREYKPRQLIYLGTACSYPQGLQRSVDDSVLRESLKFPADPESGYGWSKLIGEIEFSLALQNAPTQLTVLDLHNVYGWPCVYDQPTSQVIPSLINKALTSTDGSISVWGNGMQGRAFLHVRDVVAGVTKAIGLTGEKRNIMLGPDHCTTIRTVAELILEHPGVRVETINYDTSKPTGDIGRFADTTVARDVLGWEVSVPFREGLHELIDQVIDHRSKNSRA